MFIPTRFGIVNGEVVTETQCAPAGHYKPIAYEYLANSVIEHYQRQSVASGKKK